MIPNSLWHTVDILSSALDGLAHRHRVIAANIANANVPGHAARQVGFVDLLEREQARAVGPSAPLPGLPRGGADGTGQPVQLDREMALMSHNALLYGVLLKGVGRHLSLLASAVGEGRR